METTTINILEGTIAFLNGDPGLHYQQENYVKFLTKAGKNVVVLDDLYNQPEKLNKVRDCETLYLQTTGFRSELKDLVNIFKSLNYVPKNVIFDGENTAMVFLSLARTFKKEHGTRFFFEDLLDQNQLLEINWI